MEQPTFEQRKDTVQSLRNIAGLIKTGMYLGQNAQYVADALSFLENTALTVEQTLRPTVVSAPDDEVKSDGQA